MLSCRTPRIAGLTSGVLVTVFLAFSAGTITLNPGSGVNVPDGQLITTLPVANPLVMWPAVEVYFPSIPFSGMVSVGTAILFSFLETLVALNVAVLVAGWESSADVASSRSLFGTAATTGATACCCCAPALYGITSAILGASASPLYWTFMDSTSPLSGLFLAGSLLLLTGSLVQTAGSTVARAVAGDSSDQGYLAKTIRR